MAWKVARKVRRKIPDLSMGVEKKVGRLITFRLSCMYSCRAVSGSRSKVDGCDVDVITATLEHKTGAPLRDMLKAFWSRSPSSSPARTHSRSIPLIINYRTMSDKIHKGQDVS